MEPDNRDLSDDECDALISAAAVRVIAISRRLLDRLASR
jgi:hypothetical protein